MGIRSVLGFSGYRADRYGAGINMYTNSVIHIINNNHNRVSIIIVIHMCIAIRINMYISMHRSNHMNMHMVVSLVIRDIIMIQIPRTSSNAHFIRRSIR